MIELPMFLEALRVVVPRCAPWGTDPGLVVPKPQRKPQMSRPEIRHLLALAVAKLQAAERASSAFSETKQGPVDELLLSSPSCFVLVPNVCILFLFCGSRPSPCIPKIILTE